VLCSLFGIPVGLLLLTSIHQQAVKIVLAICIIVFSIYSLVGRRPPELKNDSWAWLFGCGFVAGVIGGAFGMNGPPLVIYGRCDAGRRSIFARRCRHIFCRRV